MIGAGNIDEARRWTDSVRAWDLWAEGMANPADRINRPLLDLAAATPGQRVLDLAAGVGEPALSQARRLDGDGLVVASDLVPAMLSGLRRRAAGLAHPPLPVAADMTTLPFATACFDHVLCRFGLMFVPDVPLALAEMRRVLRPGGAAALAVWGPRADNNLFDRLGRLLEPVRGAEVAALLAPLFRFADPAGLKAMAQDAGFATVQHEALKLRTPARVDQPFWLPTLEMAFSPLVTSLSQAERAVLHERIATDFQNDADAERRFSVTLSVHLLRLGT
ncbi:class I SAM-dependent methyltransferase [Niveispirillum sp. KHB5.9]|uniref:class I SAM-dependent methyltransferase n=1 Tax=Niveispirillum sp. KHB5.9 TaxID=3400269 RepID=UPI003A843F51